MACARRTPTWSTLTFSPSSRAESARSSAGTGCANDSLLHLAGVKAVDPDYERLGELWVTRDDIKRFRQLDSKCPGAAGPRASRPPRDPWARVWPPAWAWVRRSAEGDRHERELGEDLTPLSRSK